MRRIMSFLMSLLLILILMGCATPQSYQGAGVGGVLGGIAGALLDRNPWRGGVIGGALGAVAGATLTEISAMAAREAVVYNRPVEYRTEGGRGIYRAEPMGYNEQTRCSKTHERVWEDGRLVKDQIREICEGTNYERRMQAPPIAQTLIREGSFAMKLAEALKTGEVKSEAEAESRLASMGIAPRNGWIADYPVTPNIIGELQNAIGVAVDSGKLAMNKDEALKAFQVLIDNQWRLPVAPGKELSRNYGESPPVYEGYEPYYYPYPYYGYGLYSYPYLYYYGGYYRYRYFPYHRYWGHPGMSSRGFHGGGFGRSSTGGGGGGYR
jgi:hypothetical protein